MYGLVWKNIFIAMALAAMEAASLSTLSSHPFTYTKFHSFNKPFSSVSLKFPLYTQSTPKPIKNPVFFHLHAAVEEETVVLVKKSVNSDKKRKLFVLNLPWSLSVVDIKKMFSECGTVSDVEIIKQKNGKNRGFAFVAMASGEEAQAAIDKFDNLEMAGRKISIQFAKRFKKPRPSIPVSPPVEETRHRLYVSNLAWKVRSNNLRQFFSSESNPVSARVIFDGTSGGSAGYGFVSFATKEEAESAISIYEGKELLGRQIKLKFSDKYSDYSKTDEESSKQPSEDLVIDQ